MQRKKQMSFSSFKHINILVGDNIMQIKELISESGNISEAQPMGMLNKFGNKILSKVGGNVGSVATGKLNSGNRANQLMDKYQQWLGQTGEQASKENLLKWLAGQGLPTQNAEKVLSAPVQPSLMQKVGGAVKGAVAGAQQGYADASTPQVQTQSVMRDLIDMISEDVAINNDQVSKAILAAVQQNAGAQATPADIRNAAAPTSNETDPRSNQTTTNPAVAGQRIGKQQGKQAVDNAMQTVKSVRARDRGAVLQYAKQQINTLSGGTV